MGTSRTRLRWHRYRILRLTSSGITLSCIIFRTTMECHGVIHTSSKTRWEFKLLPQRHHLFRPPAQAKPHPSSGTIEGSWSRIWSHSRIKVVLGLPWFDTGQLRHHAAIRMDVPLRRAPKIKPIGPSTIIAGGLQDCRYTYYTLLRGLSGFVGHVWSMKCSWARE